MRTKNETKAKVNRMFSFSRRSLPCVVLGFVENAVKSRGFVCWIVVFVVAFVVLICASVIN